jgi:O-antigen/teichoic acid export membrane protein
MSTQTEAPIRAQAVKSAAWYGGTRLWGQLLSWVVTILLARLLVPADYGLFAMASSVLTMLELLQEFGLGTAIIQRRDLTRAQINGVFWIVFGTSLALTTATMLAAGAIGGFYAEPQLAGVLRVLCLMFLLDSVGMVPYNLLSKALDLRRRSIAEVIGSVAKTLVSLGLAYAGFGVWALVWGHLTRAVVLNGALLAFSGWWPGLQVTRKGMGGVLTFGLRIAGTHLVGSVSPALTALILGRFLGGAALGLYAMATSLSEAPHRISTALINQISFPVFSRLQGEPEELARYFLKISKYLALISLPAQVGLVLVASDLVPLLLSERWEAVTVPFQIMCLESAVIVVTLAASPLLTALGRANLLLGRSFLSVTIMASATLIGAWFGLVGVALARLVAMFPLRATLLLPCLWRLGIPVRAFLATMASPLIATGLMTAAVLVVRAALLSESGPPTRLAATAVTGAVVYAGALLLLDRGLVAEVGVIARDLVSKPKAGAAATTTTTRGA